MNFSSFTRIKNDINGNPRYVIHFSYLNTAAEREDGEIDTLYTQAVKRANRIGGRKYHTKTYGGGIVFQSYSLDATINDINRVIAEDEVK